MPDRACARLESGSGGILETNARLGLHAQRYSQSSQCLDGTPRDNIRNGGTNGGTSPNIQEMKKSTFLS